MSEEATPYYSDTDRDPKSGRFLKGMKGGPGRPKGYRQKLTELLYKEALRAFILRGEDAFVAAFSQGGSAKEAIEFLRLISAMVPKQVELADDEGNTLSINAVVVPAKSIAGTPE